MAWGLHLRNRFDLFFACLFFSNRNAKFSSQNLLTIVDKLLIAVIQEINNLPDVSLVVSVLCCSSGQGRGKHCFVVHYVSTKSLHEHAAK